MPNVPRRRARFARRRPITESVGFRRRFREVDRRGRAGAGARDLEILAGLGAGHLRRKRLRKRTDVRVVRLNRVVVIRARDGDAVLRSGELVLQLQEVLIRLELRVCLGHDHQATERAGELIVGVGHLARVAFLHGAEHARTGLRNLGENVLLMLGVALHRRDEIGNEVSPPLELNLDLILRRVDRLVVLLDRVVAAAAAQKDEREWQGVSVHAVGPRGERVQRPVNVILTKYLPAFTAPGASFHAVAAF